MTPRKPFVHVAPWPDHALPRWLRGLHRQWSAEAFAFARNRERVMCPHARRSWERGIARLADRLIASTTARIGDTAA